MTSFPFQIAQPSNRGRLEASKWLTLRLLVDPSEIKALILPLKSLLICNVSECVPKEQALLSPEAFLRSYENYVRELQEKKRPDRSTLRPFFSSAWTTSSQALIATPVPPDRLMLRPILPVVQLCAHFFLFSSKSKKFHSMVHGKETVPWGLQFSYPQLYAQSGELIYTLKNQELANNALFSSIKKWVRDETRPARFLAQNERVVATFRISPAAATWMRGHPSLKQLGLELQL